MTKTDLLELIRNGENSGVEFKRDDIDNRRLAKELVAFAKSKGFDRNLLIAFVSAGESAANWLAQSGQPTAVPGLRRKARET